MNEERQTIDSVHFDALAYGIFENAVDADSGRAALVQAYNSYDWTDPEQAKGTLEYYGEAVKHKYKDQTPVSSNIEEEAPVKISDIPLKDLGSDEELYNKWREVNLAYLDAKDLEPQYAVSKKDFINQINKHTDDSIRQAHASEQRTRFGEVGAAASDTILREIRGITAFASPTINKITGFDLNAYLTSYTDPQNDGAFLSQLAEGLGNVSSIVAAPNTLAQTIVIGAPVVPAIINRYNETKEATGDPTLATKAAALETGVQALQVAGGTLFAKAGNTVRTGIKAIGMETVAQADIQAGAHLLGNVATNIQTQRDSTFENVTEGIGQAAGIGAILGGGVKALHSFPTYSKPEGPYTVKAKANTAERAKEIQEDGLPSTPIKTQEVGAIVEPTNENIIPGDETYSYIPAEGKIITELSKVEAPSTPAFTTEDGSQYHVGPTGQYVREGELPHDKTPIITEETAKKVAGAITSGEHVYLRDGEPVIERVAEDGTVTHEPIEYTDIPVPDGYPLNVSGEKKISNQQIVRPVQLGRRIKEVQLDKSIGAAGQASAVQQESTYSQKLRQSALPDSMKAVGEEGIFYTPITIPEVGAEVNSFVQKAGIDGAKQALKDPNVNPVLRSGIANYLHNFYGEKISEAFQQGDVETARILGEDFKAIAPDISAQGTATAQSLVTLRDKSGIDPVKIVDVYERAYEQALIEEGKVEGVDPLEIGQAPKQVEAISKQIEETNRKIEAESKLPSEEVRALDEAIYTIESQAAEKLDTDLQAIEQETQHHEEVIATTEKKAVRAQRKNTQALESAIAKDSEELVNALNDAQDLKAITAEESVALEEGINKSIKAAESKANSEISKAVKEERAAIETEKKTQLQRAEERVAKAETALKERKASAQEQLKKLKMKERELIKENQDTSSIAEKIAKIEDGITKAAQRVADAKALHEEAVNRINEETDASREAEELYKELESGVEVKVVPVGKKRTVQIRTKKSGMNITKLFNNKSEAYAPLSALSRSVNELTGVVRQSLGTKIVNNERISNLQKRINENKSILERTKSRDVLSDPEKQRIAAAKKRLKELEKHKAEATLESRIPAKEKQNYVKFKERRAAAPKSEASASVKAAKDRLRELEKAREKATRLAEKQRKATERAAEKANAETENQRRIGELKNLLKNETITGAKKQEIQSEIYERQAANASPSERPWLFSLWVRNQIGGGFNGLVALWTGYGSILLDTAALIAKDIATGKPFTGKSEAAAYLKGVADIDAWSRGVALASIAWRTGERLTNIIPREEITALAGKFKLSPKTKDYEATIKDFVDYSKSLQYGKNPLKNLATLAVKTAGPLTEPFLRFLALNEALVYSVKHAGFDRASAAYYYNKGKNAGITPEELIQYQYNPRENWERAKAEAANQTAELKKAGIDTTKEQEYINAVEKYQALAPKEVQVSAFKQAAQAVTTGPAGGYAGVVADLIKLGVDVTGGNKSPVKFLAPFSNAIANLTSMHLAFTPYGFLDTVGPSNRTSFERSLIRAQAATGTIAGVAAVAYLRSQMLQNPKEEPYITFIGNYSKDKAKRDAYRQSGGQLNSLKIGNTYVPFGEAPWALWAYGVAKSLDSIRDGEDPDPVTSTIAWHGSVTMAANMMGGEGGLEMLRGITELWGAVTGKDKFGGTMKPEEQEVALVRAIANPVKGFLPGASLLRSAARFFDNPVEARKDVVSALVEGIPGLQSSLGRPALNIFGEVMPSGKDDPVLGVHRVFATGRADDLDIRWLTDNGYEVPSISNMRFSKKLQAYVETQKEADDAKELDYDMKYKVYQAASGDLRNLVGQYRNQLGHSAYNEKVQAALRKDFNRILAAHSARLVK